MRQSPCEVFHAPFDVYLNLSDNNTDSVVQPDIVVVCDQSKLDEKGCQGAPNLVIEILSPSSAQKDMKYKLKLYEEAGVPEYWIIDPAPRTVEILTLDAGRYRSLGIFTGQDTLPSRVLPAFPVAVAAFFM